MAENKITISDFRGLFTYADKENIPKEFMTVLENLRPRNGRLLKTYGFGVKLDSAAANDFTTFGTYIHDNLTAPVDYVYIGIWVYDSTKVATVYGWNGSAWVGIGSISGITWAGTYYHYYGRNPIIQIGDYIRMLPGAVSKADGTNESKGIWLGYINRDFFDGLYITPTDYTAGFFNYDSTVSAPSVTGITHSVYDANTITNSGEGPYNYDDTGEIRYYRFSYIYDGVQESLLSDSYSINFTNKSFVEILFSIVKASHNKRITAMKVYRSHNHEEGGSYYLIQTIDFLRESGNVISGNDACFGHYYVYVPDNGITFDAGLSYRITINGDGPYDLTNPGDGAYEILAKDATPFNAENYWDVSWDIEENDGGWSSVGSGTTGAFAGMNVIIIGTDTGIYTYGGGYFYTLPLATTYRYIITSNYKKAIYVTSANGTFDALADNDYAWYAVKPSAGMYRVTEDNGNVDYQFWDTGRSDGAQHPLWGETSIKINAKFAKHINGRLWQGNIVLDPGGDGEVHTDWGSYSEIGQYDVNPVSNVIRFADREGGEITGIHEMFGNPVFLKKQAIITLNVKNYPTEPAKWVFIESAHNIGNLASYGSIKVMDSVYICYYDGIYRLTPNNLAESDATPTEKLRISEPISDVYLALSNAQIAAIQSAFNPVKGEIVYDFNGSVYAYNISTEDWRKIDTGVTVNLMEYDENNQIMIYQNSNNKVYSPGVSESVDIKLRTKIFDLTDDNDKLACVRRVAVTYISETALTLNIYADNPTGMSGTNSAGAAYTDPDPPPKTTITCADHGLSVGNSITIAGSTDDYYNGTFTVKYVTQDTYTIEILYVAKASYGTWIRNADATVALPVQNAVKTYEYGVRLQAKKILVEIDDAANSTTNTEIHRIQFVTD